MMAHQPHRCQVQADACLLPFPDASFDVIIIGDGPLFAAETVRVLDRSGTLIWSNALGSGAPYFHRTTDLWDALTTEAPDPPWSTVESAALWGSWAVFHRGADELPERDCGTGR